MFRKGFCFVSWFKILLLFGGLFMLCDLSLRRNFLVLVEIIFMIIVISFRFEVFFELFLFEYNVLIFNCDNLLRLC